MESLDPLDRLVSGKREFGEFGGVNPSIEISTTFTVLEADTLPAIFNGQVGPEKGGCYVYGRAFNPTVRQLGRQLAALEGCEAAYPCASGMAAISTALLALCGAGDRIVASNTVYGGTHALLKSFLPAKAGIATAFVDVTDHDAVRAALAAGGGRVKVLYTESVANPSLAVADLPALAALARGAGAALLVDNTFAPCLIAPRRWGADVVIHSLTKFVSGASDIIAGVICGSGPFIASLTDFNTGPGMLLGPTMDPRVAAELALRLPHLPLRMQEHGRRAAAFASRLAALGARVTYPGLASHPQAGVLARLSTPGYGGGGLLGLDLGSPHAANAFMERLQNRHGFGFMAVSLGYADTLMSLSAASTSSELSAAELAAGGITPGYVRLSVGITGSLEARWRQLEEAYRFVVALGALPRGLAPYRAVRVRRHALTGAAEALVSWPSLGRGDLLGELLGGAADEGEGEEAAAAAVAAVGGAAEEAALAGLAAAVAYAESAEWDGEAEGEQGGAGVGEEVAPPAAASPFALAAAVTAGRKRAAAAAACASRAAAERASSPSASPSPATSEGAAAAQQPQLASSVLAPAPAAAGGGAAGGWAALAVALAAPPGPGPTAAAPGRPAKLRRLGSHEVHYVPVTLPQ